MEILDTGTHPWTVGWWQSLPSNYRLIDAAQFSPRALHTVGFNEDPLFLRGFDGWTITPLQQSRDFVTLEFRRSFFRATASEPVVMQIWPREVSEFSVLSMSLEDGQNRELARRVFTDQEADVFPQDLTVDSPGTPFLPITASFVVRAVITENPLLYGIRAVNVGAQAVAFGLLPDVFKGYTHPLLRFMDGAGRLAGEFRKVSDDMWNGVYADPVTTPDESLRWLGQVLGVSESQRSIPASDLRDYLVDLVNGGTPATGNRQSIALAAKRFLVGDKQVQVGPGTGPHQIVVLVREDQLGPGGTAAIHDGIRSTGVVPAGHELIVRISLTTWDAYEADLSDTWNEADAQRPTWARADSIGVQLE